MSLRVLHAPTMVGGNSAGLVAAERELGLESRSVVLSDTSQRYPADEIVWTEGDGPVTRERKRRWLWRRTLREFDVVHFNFGLSFAPTWGESRTERAANYPAWLRSGFQRYARWFREREFRAYDKRGLPVFVTFQGDDARQGDFCREHFKISPADHVGAHYYTADSDAEKRDRIAWFDRHAAGIFSVNPDLLHVLPARARFVPYASVNPREWKPVTTNNQRPLLLHAPTHRGVKGTPRILEAVEQVKAQGVEFDFEMVEGLTHAEARLRYERGDVLIDQLYAGWYGGLAVELMALGKPVVCYLREGDYRFLPEGMAEELPIIPATADSLASVLKEWLLKGTGELARRGEMARQFVERWHDPLRIAADLKSEYEAAIANISQA